MAAISWRLTPDSDRCLERLHCTFGPVQHDTIMAQARIANGRMRSAAHVPLAREAGVELATVLVLATFLLARIVRLAAAAVGILRKRSFFRSTLTVEVLGARSMPVQVVRRAPITPDPLAFLTVRSGVVL